MSSYEHRSGRELVGFIIILIGFSLLMRTMGIFPTFPLGWLIQRFWLPALFIGIGVLLVLRRGGQERPIGGIFFILFGALFLLGNLNMWGWGFGYRRWIGPAILIWIGIAFLMRGSRPRQARFERRERPERPVGPESRASFSNPFTTQYTDSSDLIHATVFLGGFNRRYPSQNFRGGDLTAIMGGGKVDLRDAQMSGNEARIEVFALMGGIEILVPRGWSIEPRFTPILGGYEDKTSRENSGPQRLIIDGTAIMGTVTVYN
jgi:predicted membrane protein